MIRSPASFEPWAPHIGPVWCGPVIRDSAPAFVRASGAHLKGRHVVEVGGVLERDREREQAVRVGRVLDAVRDEALHALLQTELEHGRRVAVRRVPARRTLGPLDRSHQVLEKLNGWCVCK